MPAGAAIKTAMPALMSHASFASMGSDAGDSIARTVQAPNDACMSSSPRTSNGTFQVSAQSRRDGHGQQVVESGGSPLHEGEGGAGARVPLQLS